jgi:hypothetical protein
MRINVLPLKHRRHGSDQKHDTEETEEAEDLGGCEVISVIALTLKHDGWQ